MPTLIDKCEHSFSCLTTEVLPRYLSDLRASMESPFRASWITEKGVGKISLLRRLNKEADFPGCYVFIEGGNAIYVGISRGVVARLFQHLTSTSHHSSSLSYLMTKKKFDPGGTRQENMGNDEFRKCFNESQLRLTHCSIATIEIENPLVLHLFEPYAAMELGTGELNSFRTH